jgi:hypothetical protein
MRRHYDFPGMKARKNPYAARLKQPVTIRLDRATPLRASPARMSFRKTRIGFRRFSAAARNEVLSSDTEIPSW